MTEWRLAGPLLVSFICSLALRQRLSRARIQEFLHDWLHLDLGVATINQCIHEGGRAVEPVVTEEVRRALYEVEVVYADETTWKEHGRLLWLWVKIDRPLHYPKPRTSRRRPPLVARYRGGLNGYYHTLLSLAEGELRPFSQWGEVFPNAT